MSDPMPETRERAKLRPVWVQMTCSACPAQWEGKLDDGRMLYIRYRGNSGTVEVSPEPSDDVMDAVCGDMIGTFAKPDGNPFDGYMDDQEMRTFTDAWIDWAALSAFDAAQEGK